MNNLKKAKKLNISKEEETAFFSLLHNEDIIIRPADKGSGIVVLNKTDYIRALEEEMNENSAYVEVEGDRTQTSMKAVKKLANRMYREGAVSKEMQQYLVPKYAKSGRLKGNPKLHKEGAPYRTIVSGIGTPTERLAELAEYELEEFVTQSPSYLRDTTDFINKLAEVKEDVTEDAILFCFDVCKLYPSIPREEGLEACREGLERRSAPIVPTDCAMYMK